MPDPSPPTDEAQDQTSPPAASIEGEQPQPEPESYTYQAISDFFQQHQGYNPFDLRRRTLERVEAFTGRPLIVYVAQTSNVTEPNVAAIEPSDLVGFGDLVDTTHGDEVDVFLVSNGGSAEATERIVDLLRGNYKRLRFIVPGAAFSAATLMCFSGDEILMDDRGSLGPIDPQVGGVPARSILRGFEEARERIADEGAQALGAYVPLIEKYDLHLFEMCKTAEQLSKELASKWLSEHMFRECSQRDEQVGKIVAYFVNYELHKSHGRPIGIRPAQEIGLEVKDLRQEEELRQAIRSLCNQYELFFNKTPFSKLYENVRGVHWGRAVQPVQIQLPAPAPGTRPQQPQPTQPSG